MIGFDSSLTDFFLLLEDDVVLDRATALGFFSVVDFLLKVIFALFFLNSKSLSESSSDLYFDFSSSDASVGHFSSEDSSELPEITYLLEVIFFDERFELTELDALADFFGFDDFWDFFERLLYSDVSSSLPSDFKTDIDFESLLAVGFVLLV